jgi:hypothetical protein
VVGVIRSFWIRSLGTFLLFTLTSFSALGNDGGGQSTSSLDVPNFRTPVGLGILTGEGSGYSQWAAVIEGQNHFKQHMGEYGITQYGHGYARAEIGNYLGVVLGAHSGVMLYGLGNKRKWGVSPFFGIEPFSGAISWTSTPERNRFYNWQPMASGGLQFGLGGCRLLSIVRGGVAAGNLLKDGMLPAFGMAYGTGAYLNCSSVDLAFDLNQVRASGRFTNLGLADLSYGFSPGGVKLGVRGESDTAHSERRLLLVFQTEIHD